MSIRYKILLILFFLATTTLVLITATYYYYSQNLVKLEAVNNLESMANVQKQRLNSYIDNNLEKLKLINSRTQLRISLKEYNKTNNKEQLLMIHKIITDSIKDTHSIENVFIIGLDGETLIDPSEKDLKRSSRYHSLFLEAMKKPTVHYFIDELDKKATKILFAAPLRLDNEFLGAIVMQVNMDSLNEYLHDYTGLGLSGEVIMGLNYSEDEMLLFTPLRFKKTPLLLRKELKTAKTMSTALKNNETTLVNSIDYRGANVIAVTRYLDKLGFGIVVKMDRDEIFGTSYELKMIILKLIIFVIAITVIVSIILSKQITKPVIDIADVALLISQGNFEKRIRNYSHDELGQLSNALNQMADRLIDSNKILEAKVNERTDELRKSNSKLEKLSQTDSLTNIANRAKFDTHLDKSFRRSKRYKKPISLLIIDIDYFKSVNDRYGHQIGDQYLKKVATVLKDAVERVDDLCARYGGEEFAVILEDTDSKGATIVAQKIRQNIIDLKLENIESKVEPYLTVSIGITTSVPKEDILSDEFIKKADEALYKAKERGRNMIVH